MSAVKQSASSLGLALPRALESGFVFPTVHDFPPFYTLQPTASTWQNQSNMWNDVILKYSKYHRVYHLDLEHEILTGQLFRNPRINRKLNLVTAQAIIDDMVKRGDAEWEQTSKRKQCIVYWRKPEEWATLISNWVFETGHNNTIMTFYEIAHGDDSEDQEFHEIHPTVLQKALEVLVKRGVATTFQGASQEDMGIKFFNAGN